MAKAGNTKQIARIIPALTARTQFGQILKRAGQNKERFVVERRGEPGVVIMSVEEYLRSFVKPTIEVMAALPSVVLGFFAGLWLAPRVELPDAPFDPDAAAGDAEAADAA